MIKASPVTVNKAAMARSNTMAAYMFQLRASSINKAPAYRSACNIDKNLDNILTLIWKFNF